MKNTKTINLDYPIFKDTDFRLIISLDPSFYSYTFKSQLMYESTRIDFVIEKSQQIGTGKTLVTLSLDKEITKTIPVGKALMDIKYMNGNDCFMLCQLQMNVKQTVTVC